MRFSFSTMIALGAMLGHLYIYLRVVRPLVSGRGARVGIGLVLVAMTLGLAMRNTFGQMGGGAERAYELIAYSWMAFVVCMVVAVAIGDVVRLGWTIRKAMRRRPVAPAPPEVDVQRRDFITRAVPFTALGGGVLTTSYGVFRAFTPPEVSEVPVKLAKLPPALDGLTIVQLTDIHVGPFIRTRFIDELVAHANALRPDVFVITGDLVDGGVGELGRAVARLGNLQARYGTFFVTGNHDYYSGDVAWARFLEGLGIDVLRNRRVEIGDRSASIDLLGVDDWSGSRRRRGTGYDLDAALRDRDPERAAVLLAHQPANFEVAVQRGIDLQVSGHTHGGQIFPMTELIDLAWPYSRGLYHHGEGRIYVSRGCGFWGPPARVGSPPELVKLVLTV